MTVATESFEQLLNEQQTKQIDLTPGTLLEGTVVRIDSKYVVVDCGLKSEAFISVDQFKESDGSVNLQEGDSVEVALEILEDSTGETRLSRDKAIRLKVWKRLEKAQEDQETVIGVITARVKGGFTVEVETIRAFLPGSLIDIKPLKDTAFLENRDLEFKILKIDQERNNIVVSRRAVLEEQFSGDREKIIEELEEGQAITGIVKNLTDYGAFVDLGGIDGLLHITDMSWKRIRHPSEMLNIGDEIEVQVLKFEKGKGRVSLGIKQLSSDPWVNITDRYNVGQKCKGKISNIADYGCFVELEQGIEGLVHVSEMDWTNKNPSPSKLVEMDQDVNVMVLEVDPERRRISLGIKQCIDNPWQSFAQKHKEGDKVKGTIKSITDFGIFVGLNGHIDGLIHLSDISWTKTKEQAVSSYAKGDELDAVILAIDVDRERISLGIKQLENDPFATFTANADYSKAYACTITKVEEKGLGVQIDGQDIAGFIRPQEVISEQDPWHEAFSVDQKIDAYFIQVDRGNNSLALTMRDDYQDRQKAAQASKEKRAQAATKTKVVNTTIGDLIKEKMKK